MAGYNWNKGMSNNAVEAYYNEEKPLSKWTKNEIIAQSIKALNNEKYYKFDKNAAIEILKGLKLKDLRETLEHTGWHHTSKCYNCTAFYKVNSEYILNYLYNEFELDY